MLSLGIFQQIGWVEMLVILGFGLLFFGRRLPEVGRSLGRGIVEFKKGLKGLEDEIETESSRPAPAARPPLTAAGQDARVSQTPAQQPTPTGPSPSA